MRLLPGDRVFLVDPGEDILTAGLRQGVDLRYGCRHGKCASCKYLVVDGDVVSDAVSPYAVSRHEVEAGGVLLCSAFARSPLVIAPFGEQPPADGFVLIAPQERTARVVALTPLGSDLVELRLNSDAPLSYRAGQYVEIGLPGTNERRSYSMTGPPHPSGELRFLVDASHRLILDPLAATPEACVTVLGPFGRLFHRPAERPILMVATGAGLGPLLAILAEQHAAGGAPPIHLYYGARPGGVSHAEHLISFAGGLPGFQFSPVELLAEASPLLRLGPIIRRIASEVPDASGHDAYVAGPVALCDAVEALLTAKGLPERRLFAERFYSAAS